MSRDLDVVTITGEEYDNLLDSSEELRNAKAKIERIQDALQQAVNEATHEERKRCAEMVPTTWLDPLLTGDDAAIPKVGEKINGLHIEALLRGIRDRIRDR